MKIRSNMKRIISAILLVALLCFCTACGGTDQTDTLQYVFPRKENIVADRQYYTGIDEVQFPSQLWTPPVCERADQYDRYGRNVRHAL